MGTSSKLKDLDMSDKIDFNAAKAYIKTRVGNFFDGIWSGAILFAGAVFTIMYVASDIMDHATEVKAISLQNAECIYLENSELGEGQHYMICNGQIVLKRIEENVEAPTHEERLEAVITDAVSETATN